MGGRRPHHPRRGSLGYSPRKRAKSPTARIRSWVAEDKTRIQGFSGYKAGITHVVIADGEERVEAATIIDAPPMRVCGIRLYEKGINGLRVLSELWADGLQKGLGRVFPLPKKPVGKIEELEKVIGRASEVRLIAHTQPGLTGLKKKPEIMEYHVGGPLPAALDYAKGLLGKELKVSQVFEEGEFVDIASVTKGKGFQGVRKKWHTKLLHHKTRKGRRTAGTLGPWHPAAMMWTVPQSGQMGYHQRTELNKRILKMGENGGDVTPKGGFLGYGVIRGNYVLVAGSIPGPRNRLVRMRPAIRPPKVKKKEAPNLVYISTESKQGV